MPGPDSASRLIVPAVVFVALVIAYSASISNHFTEDSLWFARDTLMPGELFFHPHHLLHNSLMRLLYLPFQSALEGPEAKLLYLQWVNILLTALTAAAFCAVATSLGAEALNACMFTALLGLSAFYYTYSSQIEVYSTTCLCFCIALLGLASTKDSWRGRFLTSGGYAASMLFHQTAIFFGLAILVHEAISHRGDRKRLVRSLAVVFFLPLVVVGVVYVAVGLHLGHRDPVSFWKWMTYHVQTGFWGKGHLSSATLGPAGAKFLSAVLVRERGLQWRPVLFFGALIVYIVAQSMAGGWRRARGPALIAGCLVWMAALAVFTTWWDAAEAEFWGMILVPGYLVLSLIGPGVGEPRRFSPQRVLAGTCLATSLALLVASDLSLHRLNLKPNPIREAARTVSVVAREGDLILTVGTRNSTYYRIYVAARPVEILAFNIKPAAAAARRSAPAS